MTALTAASTLPAGLTVDNLREAKRMLEESAFRHDLEELTPRPAWLRGLTPRQLDVLAAEALRLMRVERARRLERLEAKSSGRRQYWARYARIGRARARAAR